MVNKDKLTTKSKLLATMTNMADDKGKRVTLIILQKNPPGQVDGSVAEIVHVGVFSGARPAVALCAGPKKAGSFLLYLAS